MKKVSLLFIFISLALSPNGASARAAKEAHIPDAVIAEIKSLEEGCRLEKSTSQQTESKYDYVKRVDLNGDGVDDFILEDAYIPCEAGASYRHGNGGTGVIIFANTPRGVIKAFDKTVFGITIEKLESKATVWIKVGGHYCGQEIFVDRASAISCDIPLVWNASTKQFNLAPLNQARFPRRF
ncbi:MAG: hypothetical protein IPP74_14105 [Alphaproteobacteria bacterium]|nr:hypothetical protein [Alphaproteobacteria bacterium]